MKKIKICTFAILFIMSMTVLTACSRKDTGTGQGANPSTSSQGTSAAGQGSGNESGADGSGTNSGTDSTKGNTGNAGTRESGSGSDSSNGNKDGADQESSTGVIGGMMDDLEEGVDDMLNGNDASTAANENK